MTICEFPFRSHHPSHNMLNLFCFFPARRSSFSFSRSFLVVSGTPCLSRVFFTFVCYPPWPRRTLSSCLTMPLASPLLSQFSQLFSETVHEPHKNSLPSTLLICSFLSRHSFHPHEHHPHSLLFHFNIILLHID